MFTFACRTSSLRRGESDLRHRELSLGFRLYGSYKERSWHIPVPRRSSNDKGVQKRKDKNGDSVSAELAGNQRSVSGNNTKNNPITVNISLIPVWFLPHTCV